MMSRHILLSLAVALYLMAWGPAIYAAPEVSQEAYAVGLAKMLGKEQEPGLCDGVDAGACMKALTRLGIMPLGGWRPGRSIDDADIAKITDSAILAAREGRLTATPQRTVDLLAATSIDQGLSGRAVYMFAHKSMSWF